jgi:hypothetical protein
VPFFIPSLLQRSLNHLNLKQIQMHNFRRHRQYLLFHLFRLHWRFQHHRRHFHLRLYLLRLHRRHQRRKLPSQLWSWKVQRHLRLLLRHLRLYLLHLLRRPIR